MALLQRDGTQRMSAEGIAVLNINGTDLFIIVRFDLSSGGTSKMLHRSQRLTEQELRERLAGIGLTPHEITVRIETARERPCRV
jgi:hypothetical protein